jgi:CheY-like chemotaxis protein
MYVPVLQDDSSLNIKVVVRLIESEKAGPFANATLLTADDGATAVEQLRTEMAAGRAVHFILMDFVMVGIQSGFSLLLP